MSNTRTAMLMDYGPNIRANLSINHNHAFGRKFQACEFRICGTKGAAYLKMGVNLDYPKGEPDELWLNTDGEWLIALMGQLVHRGVCRPHHPGHALCHRRRRHAAGQRRGRLAHHGAGRGRL